MKKYSEIEKDKTTFFLKFIISCIIFFVLISVAITNIYNSRSILSTEYNLAKKISDGHTVYLPNLDKRNFTKFKILPLIGK